MRMVNLEELPKLEQTGGAIFRPIRRTLELTGVSANAYTAAEANDVVIEPHDELSQSAAGHEELYFVVSGSARFTVDGEDVDAPAGSLLAIDRGEQREATALEPGTTVLVVGGESGVAFPPAAFEYIYAAEPSYLDEDYEGAIVILSEGLDHHPHSPQLHYQLACFSSLLGRGDDAIEHLKVALDGSDGRIAEWAAEDEDLESVRGREDWPLR